MSGNVVVNWVLPSRRDDGENMSIDEIENVEIDVRADKEPEWTQVAAVAPPETSRRFPDMASGTWHFRGTVVDTDGNRSPEPLTATVVIPKGLPGDLQDFSATLE